MEDDIPIVIKVALSSANRNRVSILRYMITKTRHADNGGQIVHETKFFTKDLTGALDISKTTARRIMKELQLLGIVRVGKESRYADGKHKEDYIELLDRFKWLIQKPFQKIIKDLDWEAFEFEGPAEQDKEEESPKPMHRLYPRSDKWVCDLCGRQDDIHGIRNHLPYCDKKKSASDQRRSKSKAAEDEKNNDTDKEQKQL
jgi:predicted transcriptional regulator